MNRSSRRIPEPLLRKIGASKNWLLEEDYICPIPGGEVILPRGFVFDLASVPAALHWIVDDDGLGTVSPAVHDWIYRHRGECPTDSVHPYRVFTRAEADSLLYHLALQEGCPRWRAWLAWLAVRGFARRW